MKKEQFTVCLINYARPWNLPRICSSLLEYGFDDIVVYDQGADSRVDLKELLTEDIRIICARDQNVYTLGRYLAAYISDRPYIATLDDDYIVTNDGWDQLIQGWDGERIKCQLPVTHGKFSLAFHLPWVCLGYGAIYPKRLVSEFIDEWTSVYGTDEVLSLKADRAFTSYVGGWDAVKAEFSEHYYPLSNPSGRLSEVDESAIHKRDDHWELTNKAIDKALRLRSSRSSKTPDILTYLMPSTN